MCVPDLDSSPVPVCEDVCPAPRPCLLHYSTHAQHTLPIRLSFLKLAHFSSYTQREREREREREGEREIICVSMCSSYPCHHHTDRQTSPTCSTPRDWWAGPWCPDASAAQTGWIRRQGSLAWWTTRGASRRTMWWCSPTSCRRTQKWHTPRGKTESRL